MPGLNDINNNLAEFQQELEKLSERTFTKKAHRDFIRLMANDAHQISVDNNGRVSLPEYLTKFAQLKKQVVIVGSYSRIEIWDRDRYHQYLKTLEKNAEKIRLYIGEKKVDQNEKLGKYKKKNLEIKFEKGNINNRETEKELKKRLIL